MNTKKYNVLDLFCGCGGLSKGFEMAGYHILLGVDFNAPALKTYEANHKGSKTLCGDLSSLETFQTIDSLVGDNKVDVIIGGPPCQGFSLTGPRNFEDERNKLYLAMIEAIKRYNIVVTPEAQDVIRRETDAIIESSTNDDDSSTDEEAMGSSFFNSVLFRDLVMNAYGYKCAITGKVIRYKDLFNLEAAHIKPQAHQGTFLPCNGIAMSRDMHFAFDKGFFTIDDNYNVVVSEEMKDNWFYKEYNGKRIFIPAEQFYRPNLTYLKHHRENVFNTFRQIRRL